MITLEVFKEYLSKRGIDVTDAEKVEVALVRALDYVNLFSFKGYKVDENQPYEWPRVLPACGQNSEYTGTPNSIIKAVCEAGLAQLSGVNLIVNQQSFEFVKREKVGDLEVEFATDLLNSRGVTPTLSAVEMLLSPYLSESFNSFSFSTVRV